MSGARAVSRWLSRHGANQSTVCAAVLIDQLVRSGVRHLVAGSGSRSSPLLTAATTDPRLQVYPCFDERSAGFFALGIGRRTGHPAVAITTSGTAAANLFPAVIESSRSEVPLLVITADRPARLRGTDANQTIDQTRLFGGYPRRFADLAPVVERQALRQLRDEVDRAAEAARGARPGPAHLNVQFEKPLAPVVVEGAVPAEASAWGEELLGRAGDRSTEGRAADELPGWSELLERVRTASRPLVICGPLSRPGVGRAAADFATAWKAPLLADPLSGARFTASEETLPHCDLWLDALDPGAGWMPDFVLRIGPAPTATAVHRYLLRLPGTVHQIVLAEGGAWTDHLGRADRTLVGSVEAYLQRLSSARAGGARTHSCGLDPTWPEAWSAVAATARRVVGKVLEAEPSEPGLVAGVVRAAPPGATLFVGNSMPIRDVDAFCRGEGRELVAVGFRGASGIDGNVSGALGAAVGAAGPTVAVVGDLTFLHDANGLHLATRLEHPVVLVVIHNDGGGIFHMLPIRDYDPPFREHIVMPHGIDPADVARAYGIRTVACDDASDLSEAVAAALAEPGLSVVRVRTDRVAAWRTRSEIRNRVQEAVTAMEPPDIRTSEESQ